jgi:hypothetical protein
MLNLTKRHSRRQALALSPSMCAYLFPRRALLPPELSVEQRQFHAPVAIFLPERIALAVDHLFSLVVPLNRGLPGSAVLRIIEGDSRAEIIYKDYP